MSAGRDGDASGSLVLDSAVIPEADQQSVLTRLDAAQVDRDSVLLAAIKAPAVKPDLHLCDREVGPDKDVGAALPDASWALQPPVCWSRIAERPIGEVTRDQWIQVGGRVALEQVQGGARRGQLVGKGRQLVGDGGL